jgi:hypothetical protein
MFPKAGKALYREARAKLEQTAYEANAPVVVLLAILATALAAQKHGGIPPLSDCKVQWGRSALQAISETAPREIKGSCAFQGRK